MDDKCYCQNFSTATDCSTSVIVEYPRLFLAYTIFNQIGFSILLGISFLTFILKVCEEILCLLTEITDKKMDPRDAIFQKLQNSHHCFNFFDMSIPIGFFFS